MKIISDTHGRYECPYCNTVVELDEDDIGYWNSVQYYQCPTCGNTPHISHSKFDNWLCPHRIEGKLARRV